MTISEFNPKDVALAGAPEMRIALQSVLKAGRASIFMRGATAQDRSVVEEVFWDTFEGSNARGGIALIRLWSLVDALQTRRLQDLLLQEGFRFLENAATASASLRLNLDWGFAPQRLIWSIADVKAARAVVRPYRRVRLDRGVTESVAA